MFSWEGEGKFGSMNPFSQAGIPQSKPNPCRSWLQRSIPKRLGISPSLPGPVVLHYPQGPWHSYGWTPFRDVSQVLVPTCGPEITQAELSKHPPVMQTHPHQHLQILPKKGLSSGTGQRALENTILLYALTGITKIKPGLVLAHSVSPSCILPLLSRASLEQL